jgi:predicted DNA-binding transcriptional regulator AlpA
MPTNKENVLDDPLMFLSEVEKLTRLSGTTIWRRERAGKFPPRRKQGHYSVWFRSEIVSYLEALRAEATGPAPANVNANQARRDAARRRRTAPCLSHVGPTCRAEFCRTPLSAAKDVDRNVDSRKNWRKNPTKSIKVASSTRPVLTHRR